MINGLNLLNMALGAIGTQTVAYYRFVSKTTNEIGFDVSAFAAPVNVAGSFQPVPKNKFVELGLDFEKEYVAFYTTQPMAGVERDGAGDEFVYSGARYRVMSNTDWNVVAGWNNPLAVKLG